MFSTSSSHWRKSKATTSGCGGVQLGAMGLLGPPFAGQQAVDTSAVPCAGWRFGTFYVFPFGYDLLGMSSSQMTNIFQRGG